MKAVIAREPGGPDVLAVVEHPEPLCGPTDVIIAVHAAGLNRADLLQRQGLYPPPPGTSDIPGLEVSGVIAACGTAVKKWQVGDRVVALIAGGGYAQYVAVPADHVLPLPSNLSFVEGAALPEAVATVWSNIFMVAGLQPDETILIHGGGSGIGTVAIQLAESAGAHVITTVGSDAKCEAVKALGAEVAINYKTEDFGAVVKQATDGRGVDVVLDIIGAKYLAANLRALADDGRLVIIGLQGGARADLDLGRLLAKRLSVSGTSLRSRPDEDKAAIVAQVHEVIWPLIEACAIIPVVAERYSLADAAEAHKTLEAGDVLGKVILEVVPD